jgi:hypothetical protein
VSLTEVAEVATKVPPMGWPEAIVWCTGTVGFVVVMFIFAKYSS